ncbi:hypothetical protein JCM9279_000786 [Rhodotorula babjevae]
MGQRRTASPPAPRRRTQAEVDAAICRLMLPILPYMGPGTSTLEDAADASVAALADALPTDEPPPTSSSPSTRRRLAEPTAASWTLSSSVLDTPTDPPPAYDDLYGRPAPAPRRRSLSFFTSTHPASSSSSPATTPSSSTSTSPTDSDFSWPRRPSAQLERLDSGYGSLASTRSRESRGSCASVRDGAHGDEGGTAGERKKPGVLKKVSRALGRELTRPWSHVDENTLGYASLFG